MPKSFDYSRNVTDKIFVVVKILYGTFTLGLGLYDINSQEPSISDVFIFTVLFLCVPSLLINKLFCIILSIGIRFFG